MKTCVPLHDNVVLKVDRKKDVTENMMQTLSGIFLPASEHDWLEAEIIAVGPGMYDDKSKWISTAHLKPGMVVMFEKEFHHVYDAWNRNRIDHTVLVDHDDNSNYYLTSAQDIKLQILNKNENLGFVGELYPTLEQKPVLRK